MLRKNWQNWKKRVVNNENAGTQIPANLTAQVEEASNEKKSSGYTVSQARV